MRKTLLLLTTFLFSVFAWSQTCPTPTATGAHITLDSTYKIGTYRSGKTSVGLCFYNNTSTNITAVQYRVFYDNTAFSKVDTLTSMNTSFTQDLQYVDNPAGGYVTITLVYTGTNTAFTIPNGRLFQITLKHTSALSTTYFNVTDMKFSSTPAFPETATTQAGIDYSLTLKNFGGKFKPQVMSFKGKFVNVTGTPSKNLTVSLEKKLKVSSSWSYVQTSVTNSQGKFNFTDVAIDTTAWDVRIAVKGDTMGVGAIVSTADAQRANKFVLNTLSPAGFDFYSTDVNNDDKITVSDVYGIYARVSGRFTSWANSRKDILFFTESEYNSVNGSTSSKQKTIPGVTNFTFQIIAGQPDSMTYYVCVPGDANGTGYKMARMVPIEIQNPNNATDKIIDVTTSYDDKLQNVELDFPTLSVDANSDVSVPVTIKTIDNVEVGSVQVSMKYDENLLEFKGLEINTPVASWMTYTNPNDGVIDWGGFDILNYKKIKSGEVPFTLQFKAKQPQSDWEASPLYVTAKYAGDIQSTDLNINPSNGVLTIYRLNNINNSISVYPNPSTIMVTLDYTIDNTGRVWLAICDLAGSQKKVVIDGPREKGHYLEGVVMKDFPSGEYLAVMRQNNKMVSTKIIHIQN